ncbi:hypothetical protein [Pseudonocardia sp.]|uniref:hypothetical protein n=1 Tax=Pseudonocardia sp. TaxID=60912 RepID=UPI0031FCEAF6
MATLDRASAPRELNWWLRVRDAPQRRAYDPTLPADTRREWAKVFLLLVECGVSFAGHDHWGAASDAAFMQAKLIHELGPSPDDETWDPAALVRGILATTTLHPQTARQMAEKRTALPHDQILLLRRHKTEGTRDGDKSSA